MDIMPGVVTLLREMPEGYEQACFETGTIQRKCDIKNPDDLMMLNLFHLMTDCLLVEITTISKMSQIGDISDVSLKKLFKNIRDKVIGLENDEQSVYVKTKEEKIILVRMCFKQKDVKFEKLFGGLYAISISA